MVCNVGSVVVRSEIRLSWIRSCFHSDSWLSARFRRHSTPRICREDSLNLTEMRDVSVAHKSKLVRLYLLCQVLCKELSS